MPCLKKKATSVTERQVKLLDIMYLKAFLTWDLEILKSHRKLNQLMMISIALFTWDWRFWGPFHPRVQKLKRRAHFATVQHLTVRPRERQHQDPQNQRTAQLQSRHYESKCAQKIEMYGVKRIPDDRSDYKRKGREQERSALLEVNRKRCSGLSGSIAEVSVRRVMRSSSSPPH